MALGGFKVETGVAKVNDWMFGEEFSTAAQTTHVGNHQTKKPPRI